MFKNFKKYPKTKKVRITVILCILAILVGVIVYEIVKPAPLPEYEVVKAEKGSIMETFTATGNVESGNPSVYTVLDGVKVIEVKVNVGDKVKTGDALASFDTSGVTPKLNEVKGEYDKALSAYKKAVSESKDAVSKLEQTENEIGALEQQIAVLENEIAAAKEEESKQLEIPETKVDGEYTGEAYTKQQISDFKKQFLENGGTEEQFNRMIAVLNAIETAAKNSKQNSMSAEQLAQKLKDSSSGKSLQLAQLQTQLTSLKTQQSYYELQTGDTVTKALKTVVDLKEKEYEQLKNAVDSLNTGWFATGNGIVTKVNITPGELFTSAKSSSGSNMDFSQILGMISGGEADLTSLLSQLTSTSSSNEAVGIQVDNYDSFSASFNVGKYDLLNLKVGQKAKVTSLDSEYEGVVEYVSATASESSGIDISSIASSLTGATNSSNSAIARVKILKPDEKIIIGFDVDISVNIGEVDDVIVLPVESLRFENGQKFVFVYNEETKTVEKRTVELGSSEDTKYEISSGISEGELIIKNPLSALNDGDKITVKK